MDNENTRDENEHLFAVQMTAKHGRDLHTTTPNTVIWSNHLLFSIHLIPMILNILLLVSDVCNWHMPSYLYTLVDRYRTSVQTAIQVIAAGLAAIEVFAVCRLINLSTRIWLTKAPFSLNMLGFWSALSTGTANWNLPFCMVASTLLLSNLSAVMSPL